MGDSSLLQGIPEFESSALRQRLDESFFDDHCRRKLPHHLGSQLFESP